MSDEIIRQHLLEARKVLDDFLCDEDQMENIEKAAKLLVECLNNGGKIMCCGNGGSYCDALHFTEELTGRFRKDREPLAAIMLADAAHITCTANDYGFKHIFSRQIKALGKEEDILVAISTSGNSENIIEAATVARQKGIKILALTGKDGGKLAELANVEIRAPKSEFADRAQEIHIKVIHALIDYIENHVKFAKA